MAKKQPTPGLRVRILADKTGDLGSDPATGEPAWPIRGLQIEGKPPKACRLPTSFVDKGVTRGYVRLEGERVEHRPGGPPADLWRVTHTFRHADAIVLDTVDGEVRYRVVHQPDKYVDGGGDEDEVTPDIYADGATRVDWFYDVELES
jgi:hypothetical protein